jgi:hypothetical protein
MIYSEVMSQYLPKPTNQPTNQPTNYVQQSPFWEAKSHSANQKTLLLCKRKVRVYSSPQVVPIMSQMKPLHVAKFTDENRETFQWRWLVSWDRKSKAGPNKCSVGELS